MRLLLQILHFYKEVDLIGQTCVCLQISALSRRKPSPWLTLPWTAGTTPLEKKNDFRLCAKAPPLPREMHFHTSQTITRSHFPHRHGDNANRGKKRLSLECHKVPPLPREMHFHTSQNITFSHFPIDTATTQLESWNTKTGRKQSTNPRPLRKKTRTLRYAFGKRTYKNKIEGCTLC